MKRIVTVGIYLLIFFALFVYGNNICVRASIDNFDINNEAVEVISQGEYPFSDDLKDGESVIKSGNLGRENSSSTVAISFSGIGEISFDYLVSSEETWDYLLILVNGEIIIKDSGDKNYWESFKWYNESEENVLIEISYIKDSSFDKYGDCCYLKNLGFDSRLYSPLLEFHLDGNICINCELIYYRLGENEGVLTFPKSDNYIIEVKLNGIDVENANNSFNLLEAGLNYNNLVEIKYYTGEYKARTFSFFYNADLYSVIDENIFYINDFDNLFYLDKVEEELVIISSNHERNSKSSLIFNVEGSGVFSFDYAVSSCEDFDYLHVIINGEKVLEVSGEREFSPFAYQFYEEGNNRIVVEYYKSNSNYLVGNDCVYLKNISFDSINYAASFNIYLNNEIIENRKAYKIDYVSSNIITYDELKEGVSISVCLNDSSVISSNGMFLLEELLDENVVEVVVSESGKEDKVYVLYLYKALVSKVGIFDNDSSYPFLKDYYKGEFIYKSNIGASNGISSISYSSPVDGNLSFCYSLNTKENYDLFTVSVNGEIVIEDSANKAWKEVSIELFEGDIVTISYLKSEQINYNEDFVCLKDITFVQKNYTYVAKGDIGGDIFDKNTKIIEFDYENKGDSVLTFLDLKDNQEVRVYVNNQEVNSVDTKYYLGDFLEYSNIITIEYIESGYDSSYLVFNYNAILIKEDDIRYVSNSDFVLKGDYISYKGKDSILEFVVEGAGIFKLDFKYFTYDNLDMKLYFDDYYMDLNSYEVDLWNSVSYNFDSDNIHRIKVVVSNDYFYESIDYLYLKNIVFYSNLELVELIGGNGSGSNPFDFNELILLLKELNVSYSNKIYNDFNIANVYIKTIEGYSLSVNGVFYDSELEVEEVAFSQYGINEVEFYKDDFVVRFMYINEGLKGTTIVEGFGTRDNPFKIYTEDDLKGIEEGMKYHYVLMNDVTLSSSWNGLGSELNPFAGQFDGNGNKIINMIIDSGDVSGLFKYACNANIINLILENAVITEGFIVGGVVAQGENVYINNVNVDISIDITNESNEVSVVGGIFGIGNSSVIYNSSVTGNITHIGNNESLTGGLSGYGDSFYDSDSFVNIVATGYVGGISGYSNSFVGNKVTVGGVIKSNTFTKGTKIGVFAPVDVYLIDAHHVISVKYISSIAVKSINVFGKGLVGNDISIEYCSDDAFKVDVETDENGGNSLNLNGYIIRFVMEDNSIKYYYVFNEEEMLFESNILINLDELFSYDDNFSSMKFDDTSSKFSVSGGNKSSYLNVYVNNELDFEHLSIIINYGIPISIGDYYIDCDYTSSIGIILDSNLDLSESNFKGLGLNKYYPYQGDFDGQEYSVILNISSGAANSKGLINYYSGHINGSVIKNLTVSGKIDGGNVAGLVGTLVGINNLEFNNIINYTSINASKAGAFLGESMDGSTITFTDCVNHSSFYEAVFFDSSSSFGVVKYRGINQNYGNVLNNSSNKNIYELFFGDESKVIKDNTAFLYNYYTLNVYYSGISLIIDGRDYLSDEFGFIIFPMNNENLYVAVISNSDLVEKEYSLDSYFNSSMLIAKNVVLDEKNSVFHKDKEHEWSVRIKVIFYDDSEVMLEGIIDNREELDNSNELIFEGVTVSHDTYVIKQSIKLTKYSELLEDYKDAYIELDNCNSDFKEKGIIVRDYYNELENIYVSGEVSEETLSIYGEYLSFNGIGIDSLNNWLSSIVDSYSLVSEVEVVYGSEVNGIVRIIYLDGHYEDIDMQFDYDINDIRESSVLITSIEAFVCKKGEIETYNSLFSFEVLFIKRKLNPVVINNEFEYDGTNKLLNIAIMDWDNKFNDVIEEINITYYLEENVAINVRNVGIYNTIIDVDITNKIYYDFTEFANINLIIKPKEVKVLWMGTFVSDYDGKNKLDSIEAVYKDVDGSDIEVCFDIKEVINAGKYFVRALVEDSNYIASEDSSFKEIVVNKVELLVSIGAYVGEYLNDLPDITVDITGKVSNDNIIATYRIIKEGVVFSKDDNLMSGNYLLEAVVEDLENVKVNYNVMIENGSLIIETISTVISAQDVSYYYDKNRDFYLSLANVEIKDKYNNLIDLPYLISYTIRKDNVIVENPINVGHYTILIEFEGNDVYGYSYIEISLNILSVEVCVEIDSLSSYYGDEIKPLTYTLNEEINNISDIGIVIEKEEGDVVGRYKITGEWSNKNYIVTFVEAFYDIKPREIKIKIDNKESVYGGSLLPLTYKIISGSIVEGDDLNIELRKENGLDAGEYVISGTYLNSQYNVMFIEGVYTIDKLDIENIEFNDINTVYTGEDVMIGVNSTRLSDGSVADVKYYYNNKEVSSFRNAGRYLVKAMISNKNYNTLELEAIIDIAKGENKLGHGNNYYEYEYSGHEIDYTLDNTRFSDGTSAVVTYQIEKNGKIVSNIVDIGRYVVVVNINDSNGNYINKRQFITIDVNKKEIMVKYSNNSFVYNGNRQSPLVDCIIGFSVSYNTLDGLSPIDVGDYKMTIESTNSNYLIVNSQYDFSINPIVVSIENFDDRDYVFKGANYGINYRVANLVYGDDIEVEFKIYVDDIEVDNIYDVNEYVVKPWSLTGKDCLNYTLKGITYYSIIKVVPKDIIIMPQYSKKIFKEADGMLMYSLSERLYGVDTISGKLSREEGEDVGKYALNLGSLTASKNYNLILDTKIEYFEIVPRPVVIEYDKNYSLVYDGDEKKLEVNVEEGAHVEYIGNLVDAGTYTIRVIIDDSNYCLPDSYEDLIVKIDKKDISNEITIENSVFKYTGNGVEPIVEVGGYSFEVSYYNGEIKIEEAINPGIYFVRVIVDDVNVKADLKIKFEVLKIEGIGDIDIRYESFYNKIVMEFKDNLEYSMNGRVYFSSNIIQGLKANTKYDIYVRVKENDMYYASDSVVYKIQTTGDPKYINDCIDRLTEEINLSNLELIKQISSNLKDVNEKDIDDHRLNKYIDIKNKFNSVKDSYLDNVDECDSISRAIENKITLIKVTVAIAAIYFVIRRKIRCI